ncbi:MAG: pyridoxal phosphate-dependent aminotransferase [Planctomycetota bacterium]|nr:MAG: pyridoxal phosphate-dependent aminotransferase [Planctomycetota bacterium]
MTKTLPPLNLASRMSRLGTETAFEVLARAKALEAEGRDIVHLEIGEPDFDTPKNIVEAGVDALRAGWTHYGPANGQPPVRETIADYVGRFRGIQVEPTEVVVVPGGKPIMFFALLALAETGDEVIYPNPGFPIYESMIRFVGAKAVSCPIREQNGFALDPQDVISRLTPNTKVVILNSPANPTGGVTGRDQLQEVLAALKDRPDISILSDEIYHRMLYDGEEHISPMSDPEIRDQIILLDGFSKTYAMTGWRLGYGVMRSDLAEQITKLMVNSNSCTASFTQVAGIEALTGDQSGAEAMCAEFDKRRKHIVKLLNEVPGMSCHLPKGAFYVFPNIKETGWSSDDLQKKILNEGGVACLAGTAFGAEGEGYLRFSYANSIPAIEEGVRRVRKVLESL